jgi:hypothetical protein
MLLAYLIGNVIELKEFDGLPLCTDPDQTHCFFGLAQLRQGFFIPKNSETAMRW